MSDAETESVELLRQPSEPDLKAAAVEAVAALHEGWQRWELREVVASVLRSRGCQTTGAYRIAIEAVKGLGASLKV